MNAFYLATAVCALFLHRVVLWTLPHFRADLAAHPVANAAVGFVSDLSFAALLFAVFGGAARFFGKRPAWRVLAPVVALAWVVLLASHMRYVEYFGFTIRPMHLSKLFTGEAFGEGVTGLLSEPLAVGMLILPLALGAVIAWTLRKRRPSWGTLAGALVVAGACHGVVNHFKAKGEINRELRFSPVAALYYNWAEQKKYGAMFAPTGADLARVKEFTHGARTFAGDPSYPLWQRTLPGMVESPGRQEWEKWRSFLAREGEAKGPWNVVLILGESLRAAEIDERPDLFARLPARLARGVRFTETYSAGMHTSHGQIASQCSVYNAGSLDLMFMAPRARLACLSDIFRGSGRSTYFFYGGDNAFDHQDVFYPLHAMQHVEDRRNFPPDTVKAGWGYSDHAVFNRAVDVLKAEHSPFFATVLSLTNHVPYEVPSDAPPGLLDPSKDDRERILQYVDWSLDDLLARISSELPHTLVIVTADHGIFRGEAVGNHDWSLGSFRTVTRVPLSFWAKDMPPELAGVTFGHVTSTGDIAPTVLSLLGMDDVPNQFMGANAFDSTRERVLMNWQNHLFWIKGTSKEPEPVDDRLEATLGTLLLGDLLAPRR